MCSAGKRHVTAGKSLETAGKWSSTAGKPDNQSRFRRLKNERTTKSRYFLWEVRQHRTLHDRFVIR